jgi:hypothetical protein
MDSVQGSIGWLQERAGKITASCFSDVLAKGTGKVRETYMRRLLGELLSGKPYVGYKNANMERGNEQEPFARMAYEAQTGNIVEEVGFIPHPLYDFAGGSPDGLIDEDGGIEIKSVMPHVQAITILDGGYPSAHKAQIQGCLWVTDRKWWDFVSFCPDMIAPHLRLYVFRVERDEAYIKALSDEVILFQAELNITIKKLEDLAK